MQTLLNTLNLFNWIDLFVLLVFIRLICISLKTGLPTEIFKFLGTCSSLYLALHYYTPLAVLLSGKTTAKTGHLPIFDVVCFSVLTITGYLIFFLIRLLFNKLVTAEIVPTLSKWGAFILALARAALISSLVLCAFIVSGTEYFSKIVHRSYSGARVLSVAPTTYSLFWNKLMSKFMAQESINKSALTIK